MPLNSFEFDAPKWHDFSKPSFIEKQKMLLQFLDTSYHAVPLDLCLFDAESAEMSSESNSWWFEMPHPEHEELVSGMVNCSLDSPTLVRTKLGPPLRRLPSTPMLDEFSLIESVPLENNSPHSRDQKASINDITLSPTFTPLCSKRIRTTPDAYNASPPFKTIFYSPKNIPPGINNKEHGYTTGSSLSSDTSVSFLSDSFFSASPRSKSTPKRFFHDEYDDNDEGLDAKNNSMSCEENLPLVDEEEKIEIAPISKLLQAFLDKRHSQQDNMLAQSLEKTAANAFAVPTCNMKPIYPSVDSRISPKIALFPHLNASTACVSPIEQNEMKKKRENDAISFAEPIPPKQTLCFTSIQQKLIPKKKDEFCYSNRPVVVNPRWNLTGKATISKQKSHPERASDQMDELYSILAEHNAKVRKARTTINIRNFSR